jgi:hypothetical protein
MHYKEQLIDKGIDPRGGRIRLIGRRTQGTDGIYQI